MTRDITLNGNELEQVKKLMMQHSLSLAVAESLTSGNIQAKIGSISGASNFFKGGVTAYDIDQKVSLLGINRTHAEEVNCVSIVVAREMAEGVCKMFGTDVGLATTGYAEPASVAEYSDPYAYYAIWHKFANFGRIVKEDLVRQPGAGRVDMQHRVTDIVLFDLLKYLEDL